MPLKLRPTGVGSGIDKDRPDYTVTAASGPSAASMTRGGPDSLRWFWSMTVTGPTRRPFSPVRDPLNRASRDAELSGDLVEAGPPRSCQSVTDSLFGLGWHSGAPESFAALGAARLCPGNAGAHPLNDVRAWPRLGVDEARLSLTALQREQPQLSIEWMGANVPYQTPELVERYLEGIRKAGLNGDWMSEALAGSGWLGETHVGRLLRKMLARKRQIVMAITELRFRENRCRRPPDIGIGAEKRGAVPGRSRSIYSCTSRASTPRRPPARPCFK